MTRNQTTGTRAGLIVCVVLGAVNVLIAPVYAQKPDARIWNNNVRQVQMLNGNVWMQAPFTAQQDGNVLFWPSFKSFSPNINALFDPAPVTIQQYRAASLPTYASMGFRIIKEQILYDRIWEVESTTPGTGLRYYQRAFETETGVVVVTATARANRWSHSSTTQMIRTMQTLMVYY